MAAQIESRDMRAAAQPHDAWRFENDSLESKLPTIDPASRDVVNEWLTHRGTPVFRIDSGEYELTWLAQVEARWHVAVELVAGSHRALIALDGFAAVDPLMVGEPFTLMPAPMRDLAVHRLAARVLASAPRAIAEAVEVRAIHWSPQALPDWPCRVSFSMKRRPEGAHVQGCLMLEHASGMKWLHEMLPTDNASVFKRLSVCVPMRLLLGQSEVQPEELNSLEDGDVVWITTASIARDGIVVDLLAPRGRRAWRCRAKQQSLQIVAANDDARTLDIQAASRVSITGAQSMSAERLQLEVPVTFDLGELNLPLQDVERLQPGQMIELPQDVSTATVTVRVGGRRIAEGALIAVGKRLGVRISATVAGSRCVAD